MNPHCFEHTYPRGKREGWASRHYCVLFTLRLAVIASSLWRGDHGILFRSDMGDMQGIPRSDPIGACC